jgi:cytochrome c nitrite reductase small subunit
MDRAATKQGLTLAGAFLAALLGVFLGVSAFTFTAAKGYSYLSNDPAACVNCHIMREQYDGWQKASHHTVATCNDCHVPHDLVGKYWTKAENGYWHSKGFTFQDFHEPIQLRDKSRELMNHNCLYCHREFVSEVASHSDFARGFDCARCHADVGHGAPE